MEIRLIQKRCPNCGANIKFKLDDKSATCAYCGTFVLIEYKKENMYNPINEQNAKRIYVNKTAEILKWLSYGIVSCLLIIVGLAICSFSNPIYGIILILAGIISILPLKLKIFNKLPYLKSAIIAVFAFIGFFGGMFNSYELPTEFQGKYISDTTDLIVEIKGNTIIVNDDGNITKEKIYTWDETYGHITYYNIKVDDGEYNFRIVDNSGMEYQFYERPGDYGSPMHYFYNIKNETDKYKCNDEY
ncbi:MAG: hypothetical protein J6A89_02025 [Clostridia bacterium]|nr:hypothetical protein [Clostridia bacterium]